jgi:hypothetical protein
MKTALKRLPLILAFVATVLVSACSEIDVNPRGDGDDDDTPIILKPKPPGSNGQSAMDSVSIG